MPLDELAERGARSDLKRGHTKSALERLMRAYGNEILAYCLGRAPDRALAEDLVQQTFLKAYSSLGQYRGEGSFRAWLYGIARHRCLDSFRAERRRDEIVHYTDEPPDVGAGDTHASDPPLVRALRLCLQRLNDTARDAVLLRLVQECSYPEIASLLDDKAKSVQTRVLRALPKLRQCLAEQGVAL